jgi:hypothetical protein
VYNPHVTHPVDNSHFIAKGLTRPWEFTHPKRGARQLSYFDFDRDCFAVTAAKDLYTTEIPWPRAVEDFLNKLIEDPLPKFLARFRKDGNAQPTEKQLFAMKAALFLQVDRTGGTIHETVAKGGDWVRGLIQATDVLYDFVHVPMPRRQLCFPEHGFFLIPMIGIRPIMAMPLDPSFFVMAVPKPSSDHIARVLHLRDMGDLISGMTIGLDVSARRSTS